MEIIQTLLLVVLIAVIMIEKIPKKQPKVEKIDQKLTDEQKKKFERTKESFENLMGYDYDTALGKKE